MGGGESFSNVRGFTCLGSWFQKCKQLSTLSVTLCHTQPLYKCMWPKDCRIPIHLKLKQVKQEGLLRSQHQVDTLLPASLIFCILEADVLFALFLF